jgi:hypothetical protein
MTDPNPNRPPLWKLMLHMRVPATPWHELKGSEDEREEIAAEIRAIADWLAPEEKDEPFPDTDSIMEIQLWSAVRQRQNMRQRLLAEADRAERGEQS